MKVVVIGGTGLIGSRVVSLLRQQEHEVIAASPDTGINTITGQGLAEALTNTDVVIDLANSPSFEEKAVMDFFQTAGHHLLSAEMNAGVKHHIALSIVGIELMQNIPYMRAKKVQEDLIRQSGIPYTIIRSTQFFEFMKGIADQATAGNEVHLSQIKFQPIAADDVAAFVAQTATSNPINRVKEIAGPQRFTMYEIVARFLKALNDPRTVVANGKPQYYGGDISDTALIPVGPAETGAYTFETWFSKQLQKA